MFEISDKGGFSIPTNSIALEKVGSWKGSLIIVGVVPTMEIRGKPPFLSITNNKVT